MSWEDLQKHPRKEKAAPKRMRNIGKATLEYNHWRDTVAIPYLDKTYGHICVKCGAGDTLRIDHIRTRGANAHLKMVLRNVQWLCFYCDDQKSSGFKYK